MDIKIVKIEPSVYYDGGIDVDVSIDGVIHGASLALDQDGNYRTFREDGTVWLAGPFAESLTHDEFVEAALACEDAAIGWTDAPVR